MSWSGGFGGTKVMRCVLPRAPIVLALTGRSGAVREGALSREREARSGVFAGPMDDRSCIGARQGAICP